MPRRLVERIQEVVRAPFGDRKAITSPRLMTQAFLDKLAPEIVEGIRKGEIDPEVVEWIVEGFPEPRPAMFPSPESPYLRICELGPAPPEWSWNFIRDYKDRTPINHD
jgi:hypothetical protein